MQSHDWQRVKDVFAAVVEEPAERRARLLEERCADDPELRREVESLLHSHDDPGEPIVPDAFGLRIVLDASPAAAIDYTGRLFGPYRIVREIGRGGMGAVFLAERADGEFRRQVALKIVGHSLAGPELERRFRRERQILATLSHPHIAHLLDGGVDAQGTPFLVMEYVDGERIDGYCEQRRLSTRDRLKLFLLVCRAVAYAHDHHVVHRDLKPSNILVTKAGVPKLLDFGIARLLDVAAAGDETVTAFRAYTLNYSAPEQVRGEPRLTPAADVFSLGVLLAALLEHPGEGDDATPARAVQPELQNIAAMARRDEPARRYPSARELGQDIERYLDGLPVLAQPDTFRYRAAKFIQRRKGVLTASILVAAGLLIGGIAATYFATLTEPGTDRARVSANGAGVGTGTPAESGTRSGSPLLSVRSIAVMPLKSAAVQNQVSMPNKPIDDQALRVGMADALVMKLSQVRQLTVRPTSATVGYLDQAYDAVAVGRTLQVDSVLEGTVQYTGSALRTTLQLVSVPAGKVIWTDILTTDLSNVLSGQQSLANRVSVMLALNIAGTATVNGGSPRMSANLDAQAAYLRGSLALATSVRQVANIFTAVDGFEQAIRLDPDFALALAGLANAYTLAGSLTVLSPQESYVKAERAARRALDIDPQLAVAYVALGDVDADYNWNWPAAEANYRRAIELAPNSPAARQNFAEFLARTGRFAESTTHAELAQQLDPTRVNYVAVRALHLYFEHRFADAIAEARRALAQDETTYLAYLYISASQAAQGNSTEGLDAARRAAALTGGAVPDLFVAGLNHAVMGDAANTRRVLRQLQAMSRTGYVDPFLFVAIHAYLGEKERAFTYLEQSYSGRSYWMTSLKVHPVVDSLRSDPRFTSMLRRMKFE